jgi:hypothetical protein
MKKYKVDVLGSTYFVEIVPYTKYPVLFGKALGWCDFHAKKIVVLDMATVEIEDELNTQSPDKATNRIFRHELVHAFFYESGLDEQSDFARDEILVDFLAMQIPKMVRIFSKLDLL